MQTSFYLVQMEADPFLCCWTNHVYGLVLRNS